MKKLRLKLEELIKYEETEIIDVEIVDVEILDDDSFS